MREPSCGAHSRYLRRGKLFLVETPPFTPAREVKLQKGTHRSEYFWMCDGCFRTMMRTGMGIP